MRHKLTHEENEELKEGYEKNDKVEVFDALLDKLFVVLGDFNEFGMSHLLEAGFDEVTRSNMSKFDTSDQDASTTIVGLQEKFPDLEFHFETVGTYRVVKDNTGKVHKSHKYSPANLAQFL